MDTGKCCPCILLNERRHTKQIHTMWVQLHGMLEKEKPWRYPKICDNQRLGKEKHEIWAWETFKVMKQSWDIQEQWRHVPQEWRSMLTQNKSLGHKGYFELNGTWKTQARLPPILSRRKGFLSPERGPKAGKYLHETRPCKIPSSFFVKYLPFIVVSFPQCHYLSNLLYKHLKFSFSMQSLMYV